MSPVTLLAGQATPLVNDIFCSVVQLHSVISKQAATCVFVQGHCTGHILLNQLFSCISIGAVGSQYAVQVLVRWSLQKGFIPLPKSVRPERQAVNIDVFGFELDQQDMSDLDKLECHGVTGWDPISQDPV